MKVKLDIKSHTFCSFEHSFLVHLNAQFYDRDGKPFLLNQSIYITQQLTVEYSLQNRKSISPYDCFTVNTI